MKRNLKHNGFKTLEAKCIYNVLLDSSCILKYYVVLTNFYNFFVSFISCSREKKKYRRLLGIPGFDQKETPQTYFFFAFLGNVPAMDVHPFLLSVRFYLPRPSCLLCCMCTFVYSGQKTCAKNTYASTQQ